jgi:hypothetical protein
MTLLELHADFSRVADALEKIVFLLEKLVFPPPPADVKVRQATLDDLHTTSEEDIAWMQADQKEFAERFGVVPGSPAMMQVMVDWEDQQRSIHGEDWQRPDKEAWRSIFAAAQRDAVREPAGNSGAAGKRSRRETPETGAR